MTEQLIYKCNTCDKQFANKSSLNVHTRTAKYCKQLQVLNNIQVDSVSPSYICDYCSKECTTRANLKSHMSTCPAKQVKEQYDKLYSSFAQLESQHTILQEQYNKQQEEIKDLKNSLSWEKDQNSNYKTEYKVAMKEISTLNKRLEHSDDNIQQQLIEKDKRIEEKDKQLSYRDNQIEEYKKEKDRLCAIINEKEKELKQKDVEMKRELKKKDSSLAKAMNKLVHNQPSITYTEHNVISNTYNSEFNHLFQELPNFTETNVKERVSTLNHEGIIFSNNYDVDFNFASKLVGVLKDLTFCTDQSRGKLIIKTEDGKQKSMSADEFVIECIGKSKDECKTLLRGTFKYCEQQFKEQRMFEDDYNNIKAKIVTLLSCIHKATISNSIKSIPNLVVKHCKQLSKRNVQQVEHLLITDSDPDPDSM